MPYDTENHMYRLIRSCVLLLALSAAAAPALPPQFHAPAGFAVSGVRYVQFDTAKFEYPLAGKTERVNIEGHVWQLYLGSNVRPVSDPAVTSTKIAAALEHDGWAILRHDGVLVAKNGDLWLTGYGNSGSVGVTMAQQTPLPRPITLKPPSTAVENVADSGDFPWLAPFPGAKLKSTQHTDQRIDITAPHAKETSFAGPTVTKYYETPGDVSSYEFVSAYRRALPAAGWTIVRDAIGGDGFVLAHYTKNGRDIWLYTHLAGTSQTVRVADTGAESASANLKRALDTAGRVAVYGIYFDSDSAIPKAESAATLQHILDLLTGTPSLRLDIEGHTDDSGTPTHNQQLSEQRAMSVRSWLTSHGIAASRLQSHGYGATRPVADNKTPEGKAKNRRVELATLGQV
jgi:outer membrane protein OmpA-like peptidoglycan-associated protein